MNVKPLFDKMLPAILPRGRYFSRVDLDYENYGYSRLPTDDVDNQSLNTLPLDTDDLLLFNGLLHNVSELHDAFNLSARALNSDTLCIKEGYVRYGVAFLQKCRGMFAFAYITKKEIVLIRDSVGIKPIYYFLGDTYFAFSSEMKGLIKNKNGKLHEVLPGEIIRFDKKSGTITKETYTYRSNASFGKSDLEDCLKNAIVDPTIRYLGQSKSKKIGVLLSGGIDSSLIAGLLHKYLSPNQKRRIVCFTLGQKGASDRVSATLLARMLNFKIIQVSPYTDIDAIYKIPEIVYSVESKLPRVVRVGLLQNALAEKIRAQGIDVVLSGEGADELFYGYNRFIDGLDSGMMQFLFNYFFTNVFYYTLLQRFERIFARKQIEGRVPFLDQEVIALSRKYTVDEKINIFHGEKVFKLPLRKLAQEIGLPDFIFMREKIKMTKGVTMQENTVEIDGYLEKQIKKILQCDFTSYIENIFSRVFPIPLANESCRGTEEIAMAYAEEWRNMYNKDLKV